MENIFIIIWLLTGLITVWRHYHGINKYWYETFNKKESSSLIRTLLFVSPIFIAGGIITAILFTSLTHVKGCWWFRIPNN